jgi:hypothetical protein
MKKTMKKIATIGVATVIAASSLTGVAAANLGSYPAPFVKDGSADFLLVIGANAASSDVVGALDIAASLQASSVTEEMVSVGGATSTSIEGGAKIAQSGKDLLLGVDLDDTKDRLTRSDLPQLLADGELKIQSTGRDFTYDQELIPGSVAVKFGTDPSDLREPSLYLETQDPVWEYILKFRQNVDFTSANDSETITMLGKTFTIDPKISADGKITLYGSDVSEYMELNVPKTITSNGKQYEVEIISGNTAAQSGAGSIVLQVNGVRRTMRQTDSYRFGDLDIFVRDVFVSDVPTLAASAQIFVGSQKIELPQGDQATNFEAVQINGRSVNGVDVAVISAAEDDNTDIVEIRFQFTPRDLSNDVAGFPEINFLAVGEKAVDPIFETFGVHFSGPNMALDSDAKAKVQFIQSGRDAQLSFTNDRGEMITFVPYTLDNSGDIKYKGDENDGKGFVGSVTTVERDNIFILQEGAGDVKTTKVYESRGTVTRDTVKYAVLRDLGTGQTIEIQEGRQIGSALSGSNPVLVQTVDHNAREFDLSHPSSDAVFVKGGLHSVSLSQKDAAVVNVTVTENLALSGARDQVALASASVFNVSIAKENNNNRIMLDLVSNASTQGTSDNGNTEKFLSVYGTFAEVDARDGKYAHIWLPADRNQELKLNVFFAPVGSKVSVTGGSSVTTTVVNPIGVGIGVLDTDVRLATATKNLIVVGGPSINSIAAELLGNPVDPTTVFEPGTAVVNVYDLDNGKVAMLVAGYEARETLAASRAVANKNADIFRSGANSAILTVTGANSVSVRTN